MLLSLNDGTTTVCTTPTSINDNDKDTERQQKLYKIDID